MEDLSKFSHNQASNAARYAARVALIVGGCIASSAAKEAHTSFTVGATVRAVANLELNSAPRVLHISAIDLQRGYLDAPEPTKLSISSNSQSGYALDFLSVAPIFSSLSVQGLGADVDLGAEGGSVVQRWQRSQPIHLALKFRFVLAPQLIAGDYPWPLRLSARPLDSI